jgi:hypothetical protein
MPAPVALLPGATTRCNQTNTMFISATAEAFLTGVFKEVQKEAGCELSLGAPAHDVCSC